MRGGGHRFNFRLESPALYTERMPESAPDYRRKVRACWDRLQARVIMSFEIYRRHYEQALKEIREAGMWKEERHVITPQRPRLEIEGVQLIEGFGSRA